MPILILFAFNWFVLFVALYIGDSFWHHRMTPALAVQVAAVAFALIGAMAFLFNSPAGQWFVRLLSGARKPIGREHEKLDPMIAQVQEAIHEQLGLAPIAIKLMLVDEPLPNAFAVGKGTLILSRALYETANDDELTAVIAHEFGHLHHGDSQRLGIALGVSLISLLIAAVSGFIATFCGALAKNAGEGKELGIVIFIFSILPAILAAIFWLFVKMGNGVLRLITLFVGRKQEYAADAFVVKIGYGAGLLSYLDKIKNMQFGKPTRVLDRLYATHPPIMLRIGELEKLVVADGGNQ